MLYVIEWCITCMYQERYNCTSITVDNVYMDDTDTPLCDRIVYYMYQERYNGTSSITDTH